MTQTSKTFAKIINNYNPEKNLKKQKIQQKKRKLIAEDRELKEAKILEARKAKKQKNEQQVTSPNYDALDVDQKEFVNAFIEYNELMLLNDSNKKLINCFTKSLGENAKAAIEELEKRTKERENKVKQLSKKLASIKEKIVKETEKIRSKESLISLFDSSKISEPAPETQDEFPMGKPKKSGFPRNIVENKKKK